MGQQRSVGALGISNLDGDVGSSASDRATNGSVYDSDTVTITVALSYDSLRAVVKGLNHTKLVGIEKFGLGNVSLDRDAQDHGVLESSNFCGPVHGDTVTYELTFDDQSVVVDDSVAVRCTISENLRTQTRTGSGDV